MEIKFLYIDDNSEENAEGIIEGLYKKNKIEIDFQNPKGDWEDERARVKSEEFKSYDGLILDLNLEEVPNLEKKISFYKGSSLAQEIRNLSKSGDIKEIPIVLLSATKNIENYFDKTNEDLFDLIFSREKLKDNEDFISMRNKLIGLSNGYKLISERDENVSDFLNNLFRHNLENEDIRFISEIKSVLEYPTHIIAKFIIKNLLEKSGILISEDLLVTRLGIDKSKSENDWKTILTRIESHKYNGVFSEGWERWWMSGIEEWWSSELQIDKSLRSTKASEKVSILKERLNLTDLFSLGKTEKSKSEKFWTNCVGSGIAIDTTDGILIAGQDTSYPWQDKCYISIEEVLKPVGNNKWKKVAPSEEYKVDLLKKKYPNERRPR